MATEEFKVDTYSVHHYQNKGYWLGSIHIKSPDLGHGIRNQAQLYFSSGMTSYSEGNVRFPKQYTYEGMSISSYLNPDSFHQIWNILEAEKPVYFQYGYEDPTGNPYGQTTPLSWSSFRTEEEPAGEREKQTTTFRLDEELIEADEEQAALLPLAQFLKDADLPEEEKEELETVLPDTVFKSIEESS